MGGGEESQVYLTDITIEHVIIDDESLMESPTEPVTHEEGDTTSTGSEPHRPDVVMDQRGAFEKTMEESERLSVSSEFDEAIETQTKIVMAAAKTCQNLAAEVSKLGSLFSGRYEEEGSLEDIVESIAKYTSAVHLTPEGHVDMPTHLSNLGSAFGARFRETDDPQDIADAISNLTKAVHLTPEGHADLPARLSHLGRALRFQFEHTGDLEDIAGSISNYTRAVHLTPEGDTDLPIRLSKLGSSLGARFECTDDLQDSADSIASYTRAVHLTPEDDADLPVRLSELGGSLRSRFEYTGDLQEIKESISNHARAIHITPENHANMPTFLSNLGLSLDCQFEHTGNLQDIAQSIDNLTRAVHLTPEHDTDLPIFLSNLGSALKSRFEHTGDLQDIAASIANHTKAIHLTPEGDADLPTRVSHLGISLQSRFERQGDLRDITESIANHTRSVRLTPEGHAQLPMFFSNLGTSLESRFEQTGDLKDIAESISNHTRAVQLTPEGDADLPLRLSNLGIALKTQFQHTGDLQNITESITIHTRAVHLAPEGHADLPMFLSNLGSSHKSRSDRLGDLRDMNEAIANYTRAVKLTPEGHVNLPIRLSNLGSSLRSQFERTGDLNDITEAITNHRRAVHLTPEGHAGLPIRLSHLAISLQSRFERTGDLRDITESITSHTRGVHLTPESHAHLPVRLSNLGSSLASRFKHTDDVLDIVESIKTHKRAVDLTPDGDAYLPISLSNLGSSFFSRFEASGTPEYLNESISSYRSAAICAFGSPQDRMRAASRWATLLDEHLPHSLEVLDAFDAAINLLALAAGLEHTVQLRHTIIQECAHLPRLAASTAFRLNRPDKALAWLEQGRCLVWGQQSQLRTPLDELQVHDASLASRVRTITGQLEKTSSSQSAGYIDMSIMEKMSLEDESRNRLHLIKEWEDLLKTIRAIPTFASFLQPVPYATIMENLPESGPVILINVGVNRCDAVALLARLDEPLHIPLPLFSPEKATKYRSALGICLQEGGLRQRGEYDIGVGEVTRASGRSLRPPGYRERKVVAGVKDVLESLWKEVVKPVLDTLGILKADAKSSRTRLPRIWWCPTGPLSFLPLHAAGVYRPSGAECVMDYAVASYTPTIMALSQKVQGDHPVDRDVSGLFLTCQPNAPGANSIPGTKREVISVHSQATLHGVRSLKLEGDAVTAEECQELMEKFSSIHLACHASQNAAEPLSSQFRFHTGNLNLGRIMQRNLKNADLAFLSACETGAGEEKLSDEAVHLAAGMLAAGYRRVVATMWRIEDKHAPKIANDFYQYLWDHREENRGAQFDGRLSAYALHHATQNLRRTLGDTDSSLLAWVPYVHFGY